MLRVFSLFALVLFSATLGCGEGSTGDSPVPVSGKITYKGKPVDGAQVTFLAVAASGGRSASGQTTADGTFTLTTNKTGDGAVPGEYVVTVAKTESSGKTTEIDAAAGEYGADYEAMMNAATEGTAAPQDSRLPAKYADAGNSGIKRTVVKDSTNEFDIDLE